MLVAHFLAYLYKNLPYYTCQRIHYWVYNKSRGSTSGTGSRGVLNLKSSSRLLHPWQAFAKLFGDELKLKVDTEWEEYQKENPGETYTTNDRFNFHNKKMQEWYEDSDSDTKAKVEEFRVQGKDSKEEGDDSDDEGPNFSLQK